MGGESTVAPPSHQSIMDGVYVVDADAQVSDTGQAGVGRCRRGAMSFG